MLGFKFIVYVLFLQLVVICKVNNIFLKNERFTYLCTNESMTVKEKIALFPHAPGVYRYYDAEGKVIYVGKAKDLHKRVAQYFVPPERLNTKTRILVSKIADAQFSVVDSEADALLLENNLIKQYKPKYNILLKDSKTYPWICITGDDFPKVFITRRIEKGKGNRYFGPYSSALHARNLVDFFGEMYPLRTCNLKITSEAILRHKFRPCLNFHIGKCKAPCVGGISKQEYGANIEEIARILSGRGGAIVQSLNLGFRSQIEESEAAMLSAFIGEIEDKFGELSREVIVPFLPDVELPGVTFRIPQRGDKLALLELSAKNAKEFHFNSLKQREHTDPDAFRQSVMLELQKALGMSELPRHMECFDNSNIQGTNPVASCVVFRDAEPSKKDYRRFKIKTVVGANDYASMKEVVNRRYSRMLAEDPDDLPQLIVIDGGKGQLEFAWQALAELGILERVTVIGLAKRLEEVIRVGDPYPLFIDRNSQALKVLQRIRDEAHRFGITFHRNLRSKAAIQSALREIKGVGEKTEQRLLMHYGSVARIADAPLEELSALVGADLAVRIHDYLNND